MGVLSAPDRLPCDPTSMLPRTSESGTGSRTSVLSRHSAPAPRKSSSSRYSYSAAYTSTGSASASASRWRAYLASRSRVTNLGIGILVLFAALSLLLNVSLLWSHPARAPTAAVSASSGAGYGLASSANSTLFREASPVEDAQRVAGNLTRIIPPPRPGADQLDHLVIVVGHAIWAGTSFAGRQTDDNWVLEEYQKGGAVRTFWKHIQRGVEIANKDPHALLIFSGGQTRFHSLGTEAESYFQLALQSHIDLPVFPGAEVVLLTPGENGAEIAQFADTDKDGAGENAQGEHAEAVTSQVGGQNAHAPAASLMSGTRAGLDQLRMTTESFALDSFENLLFSLARFREFTGRYPERITVVGYEMKKERFEELHARAVRWPTQTLYESHRRFSYVGFDDEGDTDAQYAGEKQHGYALFDKDMYGCHGELLVRSLKRSYLAFCRMPPNTDRAVCRSVNARSAILRGGSRHTFCLRPRWLVFCSGVQPTALACKVSISATSHGLHEWTSRGPSRATAASPRCPASQSLRSRGVGNGTR